MSAAFLPDRCEIPTANLSEEERERNADDNQQLLGFGDLEFDHCETGNWKMIREHVDGTATVLLDANQNRVLVLQGRPDEKR